MSSFSLNTRQRNKSAAQDATIECEEVSSASKQCSPDKQISRSEKYCTYCKRSYHTFDECRTQKYHERGRAEQQNNQPRNDAEYVIKPESDPIVIPEIVITPAVAEQTKSHKSTSYTLPPTMNNMSHTTTAQVLQPVLTSQIIDDNEVYTNLKAASCLYLNATNSKQL